MLNMTEAAPWPRRRWGWTIAAVFFAQLGLVLWFGERGPVRARPVAPGPELRFANEGLGELLTLTDPTLFALPHRQGFSGPAWLDLTPLPHRLDDWAEEPRWLGLSLARLDTGLGDRARTNQAPKLERLPRMEPGMLVFEPVLPPLPPERSVLRIEGPLAGGARLTLLDLPAWPSADLLTNSVVQVVVDARGRYISGTLLPPGSGLKAADDCAFAKAKTLRFEPLPVESVEEQRPADPLAGLTWGRLVFQWHADPLPATNAPAAAQP